MPERVKGTKEVLKLLDQMGKSANKVLRKELRAISKEVASDIKPHLPRDTGFLQRSITVRAVKKKKRYSVAFRVVAKPPKEGAYYAFVPEFGASTVTGYGGKEYPVERPAEHNMTKAIDKAQASLPQSLQRIKAALEAEWKRGRK